LTAVVEVVQDADRPGAREPFEDRRPDGYTAISAASATPVDRSRQMAS